MTNTHFDAINILIVDDHARFRNGIINFLRKFSVFQNFTEAENGVDALEKIKQLHFNIVVLDIQMPVMNGIETARIIRQEYPEMKIVILTGIDSKREMITLLEIGVNAYIMKDIVDEELEIAFKEVLKGNNYIPDIVNNYWMEHLKTKAISTRNIKQNELLTRQEINVLIGICEELKTKEIADKLFISELTVKRHRANIMQKIGTDNVAGMVVYAIKNGLFIP